MSADTLLSRLAGRGIVSAVGAVILALTLGLGVSRCQVRQLQARNAAAALRADSTEAANDSTRDVNAKAQRVLGDSLAGVERRAIQQKQKADALDQALGRERISRTELLTRIATLETRGTSTGGVTETRSAEDTASVVRHARFDVRQIPYTVRAVVSLPPAPAPGVLDTLRVALDSAALSVRLGCGPAKDGIRPATASVVGPVWLRVALTDVSQSPDLCRSPALMPRGVSRVRWFLIGAGMVVLARGARAVAGGR